MPFRDKNRDPGRIRQGRPSIDSHKSSLRSCYINTSPLEYVYQEKDLLPRQSHGSRFRSGSDHYQSYRCLFVTRRIKLEFFFQYTFNEIEGSVMEAIEK